VLDDAPVLEHDGLGRDLGEHGEVVRDEHERHAAARDEPAEQVEHFGLDRHVEGRRRLVGDQQARAAGEGHRDRDALALTAGELVRVAAHDPRRVEAHALRLRDGAGGGRATTEALVDARRLGDLAPDRADRVERRARLLEDDADLVAAQSRELAVGQPISSRPSQRMLPDAVAPSGRRPRIASAVSDFPDPTRR
jgi:hypothetical protein